MKILLLFLLNHNQKTEWHKWYTYSTIFALQPILLFREVKKYVVISNKIYEYERSLCAALVKDENVYIYHFLTALEYVGASNASLCKSVYY